jgi:signal transduction histidine kinase
LKRIVEQLDGSIAVESEMGRGTSCTLTFPVRDERSNETVGR